MKKRIVDLAPITESGLDPVNWSERREFCFEGQRWFDLRRYAVSSKFPETKSIKHVVYDYAYGDKSTPGVYRDIISCRIIRMVDGWLILTQEIEQTEGSIVNNDRESCLFYE
ncbi:MAG: RagB/SusD family nutrient uptake outer membrane protein [Butyricimonas faecihominis]